MSGKRMLAVWTGVLTLTVLISGCRPEPPVSPVQPEVTSAPAPAQEVAPPPQPPMQDEKVIWDEELEMVNAHAREQGLLGDVFFEFDKYDLAAEARERLAQNARFMRDHPEFTFTVEGHCDERGTNEYNLALGDKRANAAQSYLDSLGVAGSRFRAISYGEERGFCTISSESCWQKNRRAHFVVSGRAN